MTYGEVLAVYVVPVLAAVFIANVWLDGRRRGPRPWWAVAGLALVALIYTTPWDNYLVATGVWWYDPRLVSGVTFGWVPAEEYCFFVLQTLLTGLWTAALVRGGAGGPEETESGGVGIRMAAAGVAIALAVLGAGLLAMGWRPGTYLGLILAWAMLPLALQLLFGADLLWARPRQLAAAIGIPTAYLWAVDALALSAGTWTIDPGQTTGLLVGPLPVEEMLFFLLTNVIVACGVTLLLHAETPARARRLLSARRRG